MIGSYKWYRQKCSIGHYGLGDGRCHACDGPMEYTDSNLAAECKKCPVGSVGDGKNTWSSDNPYGWVPYGGN